MDALGGESVLLDTSLEPFPLPTIKADEDITDDPLTQDPRNKQFKACAGDSVFEFHELAATKGCLGRFPGSEMMGIIKTYMKLK